MSLLCDTITRAVHQHNLEPLIHRYFPHNLQIGSDSTSQTSSHVHASMTSYTAPFRCYRVGTTLWVNLGRRLDPTWTDHCMFATNEAFGTDASLATHRSLRHLNLRLIKKTQRKKSLSKVLGSYQIISTQVTLKFTSHSSHFNRL